MKKTTIKIIMEISVVVIIFLLLSMIFISKSSFREGYADGLMDYQKLQMGNLNETVIYCKLFSHKLLFKEKGIKCNKQ